MSRILSVIKGLFSDLTSSRFSGNDPDTLCEHGAVIFGGVDEPAEDGEFMFGFYVPLAQDSIVWLPGRANDPGIVSKLQSMKIGQVFRIVSEEGVGGIGTRVKAIETDPAHPLYDVVKSGPGNWSLKVKAP